MNSGLYFLVALALPMLNCCDDFKLLSLDINKEAIISKVNLVTRTMNDDFSTKLEECVNTIIGNYNDEYMLCFQTEGAKIDGIYNSSEPKAQCCARVVLYICTKPFLTSKCNMTKEEVESHDEEHFNIWNNLNVTEYPLHCSGGRQKSIDFCYSDNSNTNFELVSLNINKAAIRSEVNLVARTISDFSMKLQSCIVKILKTDFYIQCVKDEAAKLHGIHNSSQPKTQCCSRVISYICTKSFLTPKCSIPKEEVESHDEEHFNFWNDLNVPNVPGHCSSGKQKSIDYCHSDSAFSFYGLVNSRINRAPTRRTGINSVAQTINDNFKTKMRNCFLEIYKKDFYAECLKDESAKLKGINGTSHPKRGCCSRVVNYICLKSFLTPKCNITKEEVESHDEEHFNFWNNIDIPYSTDCSGGSQKSINYCHSNSTTTL